MKTRTFLSKIWTVAEEILDSNFFKVKNFCRVFNEIFLLNGQLKQVLMAVFTVALMSACEPESKVASIDLPNDQELLADQTVLPPVEVAITVDDIPEQTLPTLRSNQQIFDSFLNAFKKHGVFGVYGFVNFKYAEDESVGKAFVPEGKSLLLDWVNGGQFVGNHTYSHLKYLTNVDPEAFKEEILGNEEGLQEVMGRLDYKWFRYPGLRIGESEDKRRVIQKFLAEQNYKVAEVSLNYNDLYFHKPYVNCVKKGETEKAEKIQKAYMETALRSLKLARKKSLFLFRRPIKLILLLHMNELSSSSMDSVIEAFKKEGVQFVPLPEAASDSAYQVESNTLTVLQNKLVGTGRKMSDFLDLQMPELKLCE